MLRHLRVVGGNTRAELGLGTGMRDNTRVGLITGRAAWVPFGIAAWGPRICATFPRMARGYGAPRGRRVEMARVFGAPRGRRVETVPGCQSITTPPSPYLYMVKTFCIFKKQFLCVEIS